MRAAASTDTGAAAFPWDAAMAFGFGVLRLSPAGFWHLTPRELAAAVRGRQPARPRAAAPARADLDRLMDRFPDRTARTQFPVAGTTAPAQ